MKRSEAVLGTPYEHCIVPSLTSGGCAGLVQVVDVSVGKPFKGILHDSLDEFMETMNQEELHALHGATNSATGRQRVLMARAVSKAWE